MLVPQPGQPAWRTDGEGRFTLALNRDSLRWQVWPVVVFAQKPNSDWAGSLDLEEDATNADLKLEPAWTLAGQVKDTDGAGIPNASVGLRFRGSPLPSPWDKPTTTDREGRFEIRGLPAGRSFGIDVSAKGYGASQARANAPEPETVRVEIDPIALPTADRAVSGVVLDERDQPVRGVTVQCYSLARTDNPQRSDAQGRFVVKGLCPGPVQVSANDAKGRFATVSAQAGDTNVVVRLGDPRKNLLPAALQRPRIDGVVFDTNGLPARNIRLVCLPYGHVEKRTDAEGRFSLNPSSDGIGSAGSRTVLLAQDATRNLAATFELEDQTTNAQLRLEPAWALSGRVVDDQGVALTHATAQMFCRAGGMRTQMGQPARVNSEGTFEYRALPQGYPFEVVLSAPGQGAARVQVDAPEEGNHRVELDTIRLSEANLALKGKVLDDQGRPVGGATVFCHDESQQARNRETDRHGSFFIRGLSLGRVRVSAQDHRGARSTAEGEAGGTNVVIRLSAPPDPRSQELLSSSRISGTILGSDGSPARDQRVLLLPYTHLARTTDPQGRFEFETGWPSATWGASHAIALVRDPAHNAAASADVGEPPTNLVLKLQPGWSWTGQVTDIQGIAVTNAQIQLRVRQQWFVPSAATNEAGGTDARGAPSAIPFDPPVTVDAEGRFELKALPPGRAIEVSVSAHGYGRVQMKSAAPAGGAGRVDAGRIVLPLPTLMLDGTVVDDLGKPARGASVRFHSETQQGTDRITDRQGRFLFNSVCPGPVEVSAIDFRGRTGAITVEAGATNVPVRIRLPEQK